MLNSGRYLYVVFMCQQAIEKLVKGLYILFCGEEPPRTHNISIIFKKVVESHPDKFEYIDSFIEKKEQYGYFFLRLMAYYIAERYPSYKEKLSQAVGEQEAAEVMATTEEVFEWLLSLKQYSPK
ncbi:MAG: HEPN domain-containing protein [Bacillota bacterium]